METNSNHDDDTTTEYKLYEPQRSIDVMSSLNKMRKIGHLTDVTIESGGEVFHGHRAVLACSSEYFKAMFSCNLKESCKGTVSMNDIDPVTMSLLIEYAYTSNITIDTSNAQTLLEISNRLQFTKVTEACCSFLKNNLEPSNCLGIWQLGQTHSCYDLADDSLRYCLERFQDVCKQDEYLQLSANQIEEYLSHDELSVKHEGLVYEALIAWIDHKDDRKIYLEKLLGVVRLPYLSTTFLHSVLETPRIKQTPLCVRQLQNALSKQKLYDLSETNDDDQLQPPRLSTMTEVIVIVGGSGSNHSEERQVLYYNPTSHSWKALAPLPQLGLSGFSVTVLNNDIYLTGGKLQRSVSSRAMRYHSSTNTWSFLPDMASPRQFHGSVTIGGKLYVAGGENMGKLQRDVERFDPKMNMWKTVTKLICAVSSAAVVTHNQKIYIIGGYTSNLRTYPCIQCYDIPSDKWTVTTAVQITSRHFPAVVVNDLIHILDCYGQRGIQVYDPVRDLCLTPVSMCSERHLFAAVTLQGKIYVAGGMKNFIPLDSVEVYDPKKALWSKVGNMPRALRTHGRGITIKKYLHV